MHFAYAFKLTKDRTDGGYVATCRDISEAITQGDSVEQALTAAAGALQTALEGRIEDGLDIPVPSVPKRGEKMVAAPICLLHKASPWRGA